MNSLLLGALYFLLGALVAITATAVGMWLGRSTDAAPAEPEDGADESPSSEAQEVGSPLELAKRIEDFYESTAHPKDLLERSEFRDGVALLASDRFDDDDLFAYVRGDNGCVSCMAARAARDRWDPEIHLDRVTGEIGGTSAWTLYYLLECLMEHVPVETPVVGRVLAKAANQCEWRPVRAFLLDFARKRLGAGDPGRFDDSLADLEPERVRAVEKIVRELGEAGEPLAADLRRWRTERVDLDFLGSFGSLWKAEESSRRWVADPALDASVDAVGAEFASGRSVLLVGESGVGKSTIADAFAARLEQDGWVIFDAGSSEIVAGQKYIGELEGRVQDLIGQLRGARVLWRAPDLRALAIAGRHRHSGTSILDMVLPYVEFGEIRILAECRADDYERLRLESPRVASALAVRRVDPRSVDETLELGRRWLEERTSGTDVAAVLADGWELAGQYLGDVSPPGNLMKLLDITATRVAGGVAAAHDRPPRITVDDLFVTLSNLTGLPRSLLDGRESLDIEQLRKRFTERVVGQPEAVDCLAERVAMVKAAVTDPSRPFGVFLFAGPTGTGKTEIAKTLATYLFGSEERMIRIDMSEIQTPDDLDRLLGRANPAENSGEELVERIRRQPFSVILLDEFEKAHRRARDVFLQLFDDGRLTDRAGRTSDFRYSIIILTSNLGAAIRSGPGLGFASARGSGQEEFSTDTVMRTIEREFRPEFLNRLDRTVVFRPLTRQIMRGLLERELRQVFERRGLRGRGFAVEWGEGALEFLIDAGFTQHLGARPLKRAVERHLLAPLALTLASHDAPRGDQFLFITRADGSLRVEFVDPDLPDAGEEEDLDEPVERPLALASIALRAAGTSEELQALAGSHRRLREEVASAGWRARRDDALARMEDPDFWKSEERFDVLGLAEYQDRIERGVDRTGSLLERLWEDGRPRDRAPAHLVARVAHDLFLLDVAVRDVEGAAPCEALLCIEPTSATGGVDPAGNEFAGLLAAMYRGWAERRRMKTEILAHEPGDADTPFRLWMAVSGFGSFTLLRGEEGLHLREFEAADGRMARAQARVRVAPQRGDPGTGDAGALRRLATRAFAREPDDRARGTVVRRYRLEGAPLVRDAEGWRTGHADWVMRGDFDLLAAR